MKQLASLLPDGRISSAVGGSTMTFESPSAFSIYLKRCAALGLLLADAILSGRSFSWREGLGRGGWSGQESRSSAS